INIAFMNELAMVFDRMGIDTNEVIDGMNTKWNALGFRPGLVGGHCIGIDPYYFTYEAEKLGYHSQIILAGRKVNDDMGGFVADAIIKQLVRAGKAPKDARIVIMGLTFKENCPDIRNTKVVDIIAGLADYGVVPTVVDPWADKEEARRFYNVDLMDFEAVQADCVVLAVAHEQFKQKSVEEWDALFSQAVPVEQRVVIDVKGLINPNEAAALGWSLWRL
ncbi:nucleotide sugar dehydrogenase, partial [Odoribacter splanchnicus]